MIEYRVHTDDYSTMRKLPKIYTHEQLMIGRKAALVMEMITKWGMVCAEVDGEDSAGRQKLKLSDPEDLVDRAIKCVGIACEKMAEIDWVIEGPSIDQMKEIVKEREKQKQLEDQKLLEKGED